MFSVDLVTVLGLITNFFESNEATPTGFLPTVNNKIGRNN